ncbi:hypothetical protein [Streptomyces sp. NPDC046832]
MSLTRGALTTPAFATATAPAAAVAAAAASDGTPEELRHFLPAGQHDADR